LKEFSHVCFSTDTRYIIAISSEPEWTITYWNWEKNRLICHQKLNFSPNTVITSVNFHPTDVNQVSMVGHGLFKLFKYIDGGFKSMPVHRHEAKVCEK
jgi:hypothetical protein